MKVAKIIPTGKTHILIKYKNTKEMRKEIQKNCFDKSSTIIQSQKHKYDDIYEIKTRHGNTDIKNEKHIDMAGKVITASEDGSYVVQKIVSNYKKAIKAINKNQTFEKDIEKRIYTKKQGIKIEGKQNMTILDVNTRLKQAEVFIYSQELQNGLGIKLNRP